MTKKKVQPPSSADLASALAQTRAELGRLARLMLTDDSDATRELYDAEKRGEVRLIARCSIKRDRPKSKPARTQKRPALPLFGKSLNDSSK